MLCKSGGNMKVVERDTGAASGGNHPVSKSPVSSGKLMSMISAEAFPTKTVKVIKIKMRITMLPPLSNNYITSRGEKAPRGALTRTKGTRALPGPLGRLE